MNERAVLFSYFLSGVLASDKLIYCQLPFAWTLLGVEAGATNDSDGTLAVGGGATIAAAAIGDGAMTYLEPTTPQPVDAGELVTLTLDYDGATGTPAENVSITVFGLIGE